MADDPTPPVPTDPTTPASTSDIPTNVGPALGVFQNRYREVTLSAIVFGIIVGAVMNAAITYAGLKIGFTIVGSSIAAVLGFGVLRGLLRRGTILEINITQTVGSAVNTPNSGVIFTVPVLLLLGYQLTWNGLDFWLITLACVAGAVLGGAFIIPLRKQMLDIERLRFPSGTAVGAILKSPGAGPKKALVLLIGIALSAAIAVPAQLPQISSPAEIGDLKQLVKEERISRADMLLTHQIATWIETQEAPHEVVEHGRLAFELVKAQKANQPVAKADLSTSEQHAQSRHVKELEAKLAVAADRGMAQIANSIEIDSDRKRILNAGYPLELAKRAYRASLGEKDWSTLRHVKAGWAADHPFGYADLQLRLKPREIESAASVDYEFNGLGNQDPILEPYVDYDRNGQADLLVTDTTVDIGRLLGLPAEMQLIFAIAPFALGAGYLSGRAGLFVLAGGVLAYLIINPILFAMGYMPGTVSADAAPGWGYTNINRPLGIGLLLGGAMMGVLASMPAIREALKSILAAGKQKASMRDELGMGTLVVASVLAFVLLFFAADFTGSKAINTVDPVTNAAIETDAYELEHNGYVIAFASQESIDAFTNADPARQDQAVESLSADKPGLLANINPHLRAAIIALVGALWIWFAGIIIAQCTGMTDWSPISGMALLTVVLILMLGGPGSVLGAVLIGAALCVAITCAADMMSDLKTGFIVGAQPRRQQIVELFATAIGPVITMGVILIIAGGNMEKYGVPMGPGTDTTAPQAQALQAIIIGVQGGDMPYGLYGLGAVLGALLGLGSFSGMGVLIGLSMYLPMIYIATYGIGCLTNMFVAQVKGKNWAEEWGVPLAAGFIVGDALLGLGASSAVLVMG